jgi:hypothetical protein
VVGDSCEVISGESCTELAEAVGAVDSFEDTLCGRAASGF